MLKKIKMILAGMNRPKKTSLRKRMIFYFLLIAIANVFVAGEFLWEIKSDRYRDKVTKEVMLIKEGKRPVEHIYTALDSLASKFIVMILILILVSAVVLFMFVWQIASPMQYMIDQAGKMAEGDLSIRIDIKTEDEIAILGNLINDLSINLQEVVAQLERVVFDLQDNLETFQGALAERPIRLSTIKMNIDKLTRDVKQLELLKDTFVLYTIESLRNNIDE
ncbi:MAG: hypothetical protein CVV44_11685 [Spirochaetae bacterium HGW-Spirochaetae-1]|jgi:methyl-accepting chemotaxis protein|nr:MAG: hypothetical protein CVV44_11685 [Spirochaetae bacterium HGW-Spirochaetae-1]